MGTQDTAQALTILGILCNCLILFFESIMVFFYFPLMFLTIIRLILGIVLPIIAYSDISNGSRGSAGALLLISGIVSLFFIFLFGGIILIVAGALVASWDPFQVPERPYDQQWAHKSQPVQRRIQRLGPHHEYDGESIWMRQEQRISSSSAQKKKCVNCGSELDSIDQYCHVCGTNVSWY